MSFIGSGFIGGGIGSILKYKWTEEHIVAEGESSFTLTNAVVAGDKLMIFDVKYGQWTESLHWTRDAQVVTIKELDEELTFVVYALENA